MRFLIIILLLLSACSSDDNDVKVEPCNTDCGKLITKFHHREEKTIDYTYVTNCNDTLISTVALTKEQLGVDNGITYFINTYNLKDYYCKL